MSVTKQTSSSSLSRSIPALLAEYETKLIKDRLLKYPSQIWGQKIAVRRRRKEYKDIKQEIKLIETQIMAAITAEKNPATNKPVFSNAEARQAELERRKSNIEHYNDIAEKLNKAEFNMTEEQEELELLIDEYKAHLCVGQIVAGEVNLYTLVKEDPADSTGSPEPF